MLAEIFGPDLLIVVLVVVVVLFGGAAIPKLARNLGSAKQEFEKGLKDGHQATDESPAGPAAAGPAAAGPAAAGPTANGTADGVVTRPVGDSGPVTPK